MFNRTYTYHNINNNDDILVAIVTNNLTRLRKLLNYHNVNNIRQGNTKICPICNVVKDLSYFYSRANRKDVAGYCKECSNTYHSNRVSSVKLKMIDYKGNSCEHCGLNIIDSHYAVFDFHHLNPKNKDPNFSKIKYQKWEVIKQELDKVKRG